MLYFRDKKEARSIRRPGGYEGARKKEPEQFEGGGEKERVAGVGKGAKKISRLMLRRWEEKKSARGRCLVSCLGTLLLLDDDVVDKLFGF